jgi:hypothetical protein
MKAIFEKLEKMEIRPAVGSPGELRTSRTSHEVIDRVMRRAEELRKIWSKSSEAHDRMGGRKSTATA